ncbi:MAG TPA: bifunctional nuclease family protein [Anaerolineales bacterium]|jgi:bifunctional DNase/RNase|nr:bifunctional nuclease family protein [Anaerolineales bacterium]
MSDMIEVQIDSVRVHLMTPSRLVVLKQVNSERYLPIWVGPYEAEAITVALQEVEMIRPLTHDLLKNVFGAFNARIIRIEIVKLENDIYYGTIVAEVDGREIYVDSRSSDAIALSVRAHVPILVHPSVMDSAGILPEQDMPDEEEAPEKSEPAPLSKEGAERLTVFEDFLGKLDLDKLDDKDKPDEDEPPQKPKKPKKK